MQDQEILTILKIAVMVLFFIIVTIFGTLPLRSKTFKQRPLLRAMGATFAGCLFLNVAIMHILPQAADAIEEYMKDGDQDKQVFPLAYLLLMVGFIITIFFTKVMSFHTHQEDHYQQQQADVEVSQDTDTSPRKKQTKQFDQDQLNIDNQHIKSYQQIKQSLISNNSQRSQKKIKKTMSSPTKQHDHSKREIIKVNPIQERDEHSHEGHNHDHGHGHEHKHEHEGHSHDHHLHHHVLTNKSMLNEAFILTMAIYFHTIFEGIAIGVQNNITGFLSTAVAIAFHKWADALSMGCHYRNKNVSKKISYSLIIIQAVLNVLSIGLGWIISSSGELVQAIFLSISAGTFLAISTIQMLGQQLHHKDYRIAKFLILLGATGFVASIWFIQNSIFQPSQ